MLRYRVLLVDTEVSYKRPVQAHFNNLQQVEDWANKVLTVASASSYVVIYKTVETEMGHINKSDLPLKPYDQSPVQKIQPTQKQAS